MKILYFYQYFTTPAGAWSTRVYDFASRWAQAGDSVAVVTSVYDKSDIRPAGLVSRVNVAGIDVTVLNIRLSNKHAFSRRLFNFAAYAIASCWYALVRPADVVVSSSGPITVALPGLFAHFVRRRPFVFEVRDLWPEGSIQLGIVRNRAAISLARFFERLCYRSAARVVCLSEGMARWIAETYGIRHLDVVPNSSDNHLVGVVEGTTRLPAWTVGKRLVVYAGTLGLIDDCMQIVAMAQCLQKRGNGDIEVVIIGDGKERPLVEKRARELQVERLHFLGQMAKRDVMTWLRAAYCALFVCKDVPFLATASPNKLFDAFAAGVPVVQTTHGWIKDLLERERCGITVPAGDPEALAQVVVRLAEDTELRATLARNASRVARELFDSDLLASRMHGILSAAAGRR